jgi:hypothetical protein
MEVWYQSLNKCSWENSLTINKNVSEEEAKQKPQWIWIT